MANVQGKVEDKTFRQVQVMQGKQAAAGAVTVPLAIKMSPIIAGGFAEAQLLRLVSPEVARHTAGYLLTNYPKTTSILIGTAVGVTGELLDLPPRTMASSDVLNDFSELIGTLLTKGIDYLYEKSSATSNTGVTDCKQDATRNSNNVESPEPEVEIQKEEKQN